jgi:hypothetical protein
MQASSAFPLSSMFTAYLGSIMAALSIRKALKAEIGDKTALTRFLTCSLCMEVEKHRG